jgi:hypothetical protein
MFKVLRHLGRKNHVNDILSQYFVRISLQVLRQTFYGYLDRHSTRSLYSVFAMLDGTHRMGAPYLTLKIFTLSSDNDNLNVKAAWCDSRTDKSLYNMAKWSLALQRNWLGNSISRSDYPFHTFNAEFLCSTFNGYCNANVLRQQNPFSNGWWGYVIGGFSNFGIS